jgi:hypothetical protein
MSPRPAGELDRALSGLTLDVHKGRVRREQLLADAYQGEYEQQLQVQLSGTAGSGWGYVDQDYMFEFPFLWAPVQRRSEFDTPIFRSGIEIVVPQSSLVLAHAHVVGWHSSPESWIVGARVRFAVSAPAASTTPIPYQAIAHLSFQGYASLPQGVSDL